MLRSVVCFNLLLLAPLLVAEPLPIEHFVKDGDYLDVSLSPSGKRLAARVRVDDRVVLAVIDRASNKLVGGAKPDDGSVIHSVEWINDERLIFAFAEDRLGLDAPVLTGELFGVDYNGKRRELLAGYRASDQRTGSWLGSKEDDLSSFYLLNTLEDDDKHVLVIEYPWSPDGRYWSDDRMKQPIISRMNAYSGKKRRLEVLPFRNATPFSTKDGTIRFVTYEGEDAFFRAAFRESDDAEWQALTDVFGLTQDMTVVGLNEAGGAAFLRGRYGEDGFHTIFRLDFEASTLEPVFTDLDADIADWLIDPETGEIAAGKSLRGKPRYHYPAADSKMKVIHQKLAKAFAGQTVDITSTTKDGKELMVRVSSDTNPGVYYIFNEETRRADPFWANLSWIDSQQMRPMLVDEVSTEDGFTLPVRLTLPDSQDPAPLIVHPHGGPHGVADHWEFNREVQLLANRGYAVLQVNFRGSGYFGNRFQNAGHREWGGKMIEDIATATRWAIEHPKIDGTRICAYGASYGAYAAYMLAVREPELLKCTAGYVGVYDLNMMFTRGDISEGWGGVAYLRRALGTDRSRLDEFSPVNHADKIQANTLLVHGNADIRAPIAHARAMRRALRAAGKEPVWIELHGSGHGAGSMENKLKLYEGLLSFLDSNLQ